MNRIYGSVLEMEVVVNGVASPIYRRQSDSQAFVESPWGVPYQLRIRNLTNGRVEILTAVDGRNTLLDEVADLVKNRGMVIQPYETWVVQGFRLNKTQVRDFVFTDPGHAVATQATGSTQNVGVIGVAVYQEYIVPPVFRPQSYGGHLGFGGGEESFSVPRGSAKSASDTGTGMGQTRIDVVGSTTFTRRTNQPTETFTIQYRSRHWLVQNGIIQPASSDPSAFPGGDTGYSKYR